MVTKSKVGHVVMMVTKEGGHFLARAKELSIFTEAESLDELRRNIREVVALHLEDGEHKKYGLPPEPEIEVVYDFSETL
jgi:predicted RNase H-like HicB family nuclease